MMDDSSRSTSWDEFRLASSSFGTGDHRRRSRNISQQESTLSNSPASGGPIKRSTSNSINEKIVNALWSNTTNEKSRRGSDQANSSCLAAADSEKVRQRTRKLGVSQFLRENREGARMGRITNKGQFVPASVML
jgi:hypothetical protein